MKSTNLLYEQLTKLPYFTPEQVAALLPTKKQSINMLLWRWQKSGKIFSLKRGMYQTHDFFIRFHLDFDYIGAMSALIQPNSYLSTISILREHDMLTEATYPNTSITSRSTRRYINSLGTFWFQHLKPELYTGYELKTFFGIVFGVASRAKAVFDFLYLRKLEKWMQTKEFDYAEDLRLRVDEMEPAEREEFAKYVALSKSPKMRYILKNFERYAWQVS